MPIPDLRNGGGPRHPLWTFLGSTQICYPSNLSLFIVSVFVDCVVCFALLHAQHGVVEMTLHVVSGSDCLIRAFCSDLFMMSACVACLSCLCHGYMHEDLVRLFFVASLSSAACRSMSAGDFLTTADANMLSDSEHPAAGAGSSVPTNLPSVLNPAACSHTNLLEQIDALKAEQKKLKEEKVKIAKDVKNALKRKRRIKSKASVLTDADLVEVLRMRQVEERLKSASSGSTSVPSDVSAGGASSSQ